MKTTHTLMYLACEQIVIGVRQLHMKKKARQPINEMCTWARQHMDILCTGVRQLLMKDFCIGVRHLALENLCVGVRQL